ncbi:hypothetical protein GCK72_020217 [Caenorhabditis remanei]|uniref:Uncharacterized protein n=1 Tax=Caenorhabditis remanei TaxID=31234 RepID=A0A6A5GEX5_CAERE|nr:hypothetical protein GCK72_020217 [Caenorhabditis remanei]KAF1753660.1 hypothetical protein GCK72_020217 [Caenorhabditis remanei]
MNSVKRYFLNLHIWIIIYDNFLGVLTIPYVILPTWSGYTLGLLRHLEVSDITMNVLIVLACTNTLLSILAIFEHRFHIVCTYSWKSKWERYRHFWLGTHYMYAVLVFIPFWFLVPEQIEAKKHVFEKIPCLPPSVRSGPIFVVTEDFTYHLTSLVVFLLIGMIEFFGFMLCLVWNILQRVRSKRMSQKTYEVHVKFFIALLIQTGIPTVMLLIPLTYAWVSILYNYYDQSFTNGVIIFETLHGLCSTLVMIFIHAPYRQALFAMVFRCYMRSDEYRPQSSSSVAPTPNNPNAPDKPQP